MPDRRRLPSLLGLTLFAGLAMAQAPFCPDTAATPTPTAQATTAATGKATAAATAAASPKAAATQAATSAPKAAGGTTSATGWIHPKDAAEAKSLNIVAPNRSVVLACGKGLPPGARVRLKLSGDAMPVASAEGTVGADGSLEVRAGIQRPGTVTWEYESITPTSGAAPSPLPTGGSTTVTLPDNKAC